MNEHAASPYRSMTLSTSFARPERAIGAARSGMILGVSFSFPCVRIMNPTPSSPSDPYARRTAVSSKARIRAPLSPNLARIFAPGAPWRWMTLSATRGPTNRAAEATSSPWAAIADANFRSSFSAPSSATSRANFERRASTSSRAAFFAAAAWAEASTAKNARKARLSAVRAMTGTLQELRRRFLKSPAVGFERAARRPPQAVLRLQHPRAKHVELDPDRLARGLFQFVPHRGVDGHRGDRADDEPDAERRPRRARARRERRAERAHPGQDRRRRQHGDLGADDRRDVETEVLHDETRDEAGQRRPHVGRQRRGPRSARPLVQITGEAGLAGVHREDEVLPHRLDHVALEVLGPEDVFLEAAPDVRLEVLAAPEEGAPLALQAEELVAERLDA